MLFKSLVILIIASCVTASRYTFEYSDKSRSCKQTDKICEFHLRVNLCFSMLDTKYAVYALNRTLYGFNYTGYKQYNDDDIVTAIGFYNQKVICVNDKFPGPQLVVYQNQKVKIHVMNELPVETITLHFHGIVQTGSPHMDGVEFLTQKLIAPNTEFTYEFIADDKGTYWYHAHNFLFYSLFGSFIVLPTTKTASATDLAIRQHTLLINDWYERWDPEKDITVNAMLNMYLFSTPFDTNSNAYVDQMRNLAYKQSFAGYSQNFNLVNGKGESFYSNVKLPLEIFKVKKNEKNRFRLVNAATESVYLISIDNHRFQVVASDGSDLQPISNVESLLISPGERYDIIVEMNQAVGNYWIRAQRMPYTCQLVDESQSKATAILRYEGAKIQDPTTTRDNCTDPQSCIMVGCFAPFHFVQRKCYSYNDLKSAVKSKINSDPNFKYPSVNKITYLAADDLSVTYKPSFAFNLFSFEHPHMIPLFNLDQSDYLLGSCKRQCAGHDFKQSLCYCYHALELYAKDKYAYFAFMDINREDLNFGGRHEHPFHIHGHKFEVLKLGFPSFSDSTKCNIKDNTDIYCSQWLNQTYGLNGCRHAKFKKELASLNLEVVNPPVKDTITVPQHGYALVRIRIDNPGIWALHCHNFYHQFGGMMMVLHESVDDLKKLVKKLKL